MFIIIHLIALICFISLAIFSLHYKNISEKDGATGAYNKWWFMVRRNSKLVRLMKRVQCDKRNGFGLVVVDMDKFKDYNDIKGHIAGDKLIVDTVNAIKKTFRKGDFIVRIGGDEMAIVYDRLKYKGDLNKKMFEIKCKVQKDTVRTVSTGGAVYTSDSLGISVDLIMKMADDDMYKDKRNER